MTSLFSANDTILVDDESTLPPHKPRLGNSLSFGVSGLVKACELLALIVFGVWAPLSYIATKEGNSGNDDAQRKLLEEMQKLNAIQLTLIQEVKAMKKEMVQTRFALEEIYRSGNVFSHDEYSQSEAEDQKAGNSTGKTNSLDYSDDPTAQAKPKSKRPITAISSPTRSVPYQIALSSVTTSPDPIHEMPSIVSEISSLMSSLPNVKDTLLQSTSITAKVNLSSLSSPPSSDQDTTPIASISLSTTPSCTLPPIRSDLTAHAVIGMTGYFDEYSAFNNPVSGSALPPVVITATKPYHSTSHSSTAKYCNSACAVYFPNAASALRPPISTSTAFEKAVFPTRTPRLMEVFQLDQLTAVLGFFCYASLALPFVAMQMKRRRNLHRHSTRTQSSAKNTRHKIEQLNPNRSSSRI